MTRATPQGAKISALEGLRGLMSWWVVLGHISLTFGWGLPLIDRNPLAVDVFIMLSGFVIFRLIDRKRESYRIFLTRRAYRILPLYLVTLAASTALLAVQLSAFSDLPFKNPVNANRVTLALDGLQHAGIHLLIHIPLLQGLVPAAALHDAPYTLIGQAWSVSLEWQFYLVAPILFFCLSRPKLWPVVVGATVLLFMLKAHFSVAFLGGKIFPFLVGMCSYLTIDACKFRLDYVGLAVASAIAELVTGGAWQVVPLLIWAGVLLSAMMPLHNWTHLLAKALSSPLLLHLGKTSYSVYLVHMIPVYLTIFALNKILSKEAKMTG